MGGQHLVAPQSVIRCSATQSHCGVQTYTSKNLPWIALSSAGRLTKLYIN